MCRRSACRSAEAASSRTASPQVTAQARSTARSLRALRAGTALRRCDGEFARTRAEAAGMRKASTRLLEQGTQTPCRRNVVPSALTLHERLTAFGDAFSAFGVS